MIDVAGRRSYRELIEIPTFEERFNYLKLDGSVGVETFGWDRYLNQRFYQSKEWRSFRNRIIIRDTGQFGTGDMAHEDYPINGTIIIHHLNPIMIDDLDDPDAVLDILLNPDNVVSVSHMTHEAIHYGSIDLLPKDPIERRPFDTCPWRA
jgi:hypothetical protein